MVGCINSCSRVISGGRGIGITVTTNCARPEFNRCLVDCGNRIRVFPVGAFEASLLENLRRLDTMITEEVAKKNSDIACLGARRLVVRLDRIFTLAQVLVVGLVAGYGHCVLSVLSRGTVTVTTVGCRGDGPPSGLGGAVIGEYRQFV